MSELRPSRPARRPESTRRRDDVPAIDPPSAAELEAMERHLVSLPSHAGATVTEVPELGATLVEGPPGGPAFHYAGVVRWPSEGWPASLAAVVRRQRDAGQWGSLLLVDESTQPPGLATALVHAGWHEVEREAVLWVGHASVVPHLDPSLRIEAVTARSAGEYEALERAIFELPAAHAATRAAALAAAVDEGSLRAFLVRLHGRPVAVTRISTRLGLGGIHGVGVAPEHRGQGLGTLVTTVATRAGLATGNRLVWLSVEERNAPALGLYERLGFRPAFTWRRLIAPP